MAFILAQLNKHAWKYLQTAEVHTMGLKAKK
jgi:hypothetical protein